MTAVEKSDLTGRARLREAALEMFAERGFEATSTRAVAAAAGLSPALVTRHFGSKEGLRSAVDEYVLDRIGRKLAEVDSDASLMESLGKVSAGLFGSDPVLRGYLRQVLLEGSAASADLFGRLLSGSRAEVERLSSVYHREAPDDEWAPFQVLCLILGPLLLERVMQPHHDGPLFDPKALARRSAANQHLILQGLYGSLGGRTGG